MVTKSDKKKKDHSQPQGYQHADHPRPVTRRQMLAQGFLGGTAALLAPSLLDLWSGRAYGAPAACTAGNGGMSQIPVLIFDLAGGPNIAGTNVIVGGAGGQRDYLGAGDYGTIGLPSDLEPSRVAANFECGLAFHANSPMLKGIKASAQAGTLAAVEGTVYCAQTADDTESNPLNPLYWLARGGLTGSLVSLVGSQGGDSGGRSRAPRESMDPSKAPTRISSPQDSASLVDPGRLATLLGSASNPDPKAVRKVMDAISKMSESQIAKFKAQDLSSQVQDLVRCGYINSADYFDKFKKETVDPREDAEIKRLYPLVATDDLEGKAATITKLVVDGYAGAGVVTLPGYDYHGQGRAAQAAKDELAGKMIGRALEYAAKKRKSLMIYVYSDGGVVASGTVGADGFFEFQTDSGERSASFVLVYNAAGERPELRRQEARQIGFYNQSGAIDKGATLVSNNVELLTKAVFANWLALHGREGEFAKIVGKNEFGADFEKYLTFTKITG